MTAAQALKHLTFNAAMEQIDDLLGGSIGENNSMIITSVEEELVTMTGASVDTTITIPAGAMLLGVSARVVTAVTGDTEIDIGDSTTQNRFIDGMNISADTVAAGLVTPEVQSAALAIRLTAPNTTFTGGQVRVALAFMELSPPQS
jgi:hypothetical protein